MLGCSPLPGPAPSASPSILRTPTPSASASAPVADLCHVNGVTYCALNPAVTDTNIKQTICNPAWTAGLRPPLSMTDQWKREILLNYHLPGTIADFEGDHRMPEAALGGDPGAHKVGGQWVLTDQVVTLPDGSRVPANFADESPKSPNRKDHDETALHDQVCQDLLTLTAARTLMRDTWLSAYPAYRQ